MCFKFSVNSPYKCNLIKDLKSLENIVNLIQTYVFWYFYAWIWAYFRDSHLYSIT